MENKKLYNWVTRGVWWYGVIVVGLFLNISRITGWIVNDVWHIINQVDNEEKYMIGKSIIKQVLAVMTIFILFAINIMNILLITPILMGLLHLTMKKVKGLEKKEKYKSEKVRNVRHWFDGIIYAATVDPILIHSQEKVAKYIAEDSKVIDICCGTGALALYVAKKCEHVNGVDHASGMIKYAIKEQENRAIDNVTFVHADATNLSLYQDHEFDYAVLSLTIHEMPEYVRVPVLKEAKRISKKVIIADYMIPMPVNRGGLLNLSLEFIAGYEHFRNFLNFRDHNGLNMLIEKAGLLIEEETSVKEYQGTFRIVKTG